MEYRADFLWPCEEGSVEEAGYEFANGLTEEYQKQWWKILIDRVRESCNDYRIVEMDKFNIQEDNAVGTLLSSIGNQLIIPNIL